MAKRIELIDSGVLFNEDLHEYWLTLPNGEQKQLSGITDVIKRQLFPTEYDSVPKYVLDRAATYGKGVHTSCEDYDTEGKNDGTVELQDYIDLCNEYGLVHEASEYLITDKFAYASAIDKVYRISDTEFALGDIKTYYGKLNGEKLEKCRWQLSIYRYLLMNQVKGAKVDKLFVLHLRNKQKKDGTFDRVKELIYVDPIPSDICKELLDADLRGEQFKNPFAVPTEITSKAQRIKELIQLKNAAEEELNLLKSDVLESMEFLDVKTWQTDDVKFTRKLPTTRSSFDLKSFKTGHPEISDYDSYMKTSNIAGSLMVNVA